MTARMCGATCRDGHPCQKAPMQGQARCRLHGGRSPQAMAKGAERAAESRLRAEVARMAAEPITDPVRWLQDVGGEVNQWLGLCRAQLAQAAGAEESEALIRLYERALSRALDAADRMTRLGIDRGFLDARQAELDADQGAVMVRVLDRTVAGILAALGATLPPEELARIITDAIDAEATDQAPQTVTTLGDPRER